MELYKVQKLLESGNSIYDLPLKVVYYARVSTDKDDQINSLSNQVFYYEDFIKRNKNWTFAGGYIDEGISGLKTDKRDRFLQMIEDAKEGNFDLIITKEISRFSRNTLDSINYTRELLKYGVGVLFQSDNINTLDKDSELRLTIMASIAQEESRKTSERLKFGYKRSIEQGRVLGREPYGYFKKDGKLSINEAEAQIVRYIYEEYIKGKLGLRTICKELEERGVLARNGKPFGYSVLQNIIKNPKYKGYYCGRKTTIPDYRTGKKKKLDESEWIVYKDENIPALVSEELWDKANELLKSRGEKFKEHDVGNQNRYTYSGKLFCAEHGCSYHRHVYKSKSGEKECWNCRLYRLKGKDKGCDSPTIYSTELDEIMKVIINEIYTNREAFLDALFKRYQQYHTDRDFDLEIQKKQERIEELKKMKDTLLMLLNEGSIQKNEFIERNNQFNSEISKLEEQIESEKKQKHIFDKNLKAFNVLRKTMDDICEKGGKIDDSIIVLDKIIVHKTDQKNKLIKLDIRLKTGNAIPALINRQNNRKNGILLVDSGISQAQVSRLEKNALKAMKRNI